MAIRIAEVKSAKLSDDKKEVIVDGSGKYIGDIELRFGRECLDPLIEALTQVKSMLEPSAIAGAATEATAPPEPKRNGAISASDAAKKVAGGLTKSADAVLAQKPLTDPN